MKTIRSFAQQLVAGAVAVALIGFAAQAGAKEITARVDSVHGNARVSTDGKNWMPLSKGDVLKAGSVIQTAERSSVDLVLGEGSVGNMASASASSTDIRPVSNNSGGGGGSEGRANVVRIFESSMLGIDKLTSEQTGAGAMEETQLDLRAGRIMGNVKKLSNASRYEIKIPNGVAGIRGTGYDLSSSGVVKVFEGSVVVSYVGADGTLVTKVVDASVTVFDPLVDKDPVKITNMASDPDYIRWL